MKSILCLLISLTIFANAQNTVSEKDLQQMYDELQVIKVVNAIDITVDQKKWQQCRSYFAKTITVDFTSLVGGKPATIPSDGLIAAWKKALYADKKSLHMRTNHQVKISGNKATVYSHGYALNILPMKQGTDLWEVWGTYNHKLERSGKDWKVTAMTFTVVYARGNDKVREFVPEEKK